MQNTDFKGIIKRLLGNLRATLKYLKDCHVKEEMDLLFHIGALGIGANVKRFGFGIRKNVLPVKNPNRLYCRAFNSFSLERYRLVSGPCIRML